MGTGHQVAHGGPDSIYLGVRDAAMGLVHVECRDDDDGRPDLFRLYQGAVHLPSAKFVIYDPNQTALLTIPTDAQTVTVDIFGDHHHAPGKVVIGVLP